MNYWREGSTTTRVLIVAIVAGAACILALLCILVLSLLGIIPRPGGSQPEAGGGAVVVPTAAPGAPTLTANANINIRSGPGLEYPVIGILAQGQSAEAIGVSPDQGWWAIKFPPSPTAQGWVSTDFVTAENTQNLPVVQPPPVPTPTTAPPVIITDWQGEYFDNRDLSGEPVVVRNDAEINFDWTGQPPAPGIPPENYSVRWTQSRDIPAGTYRFTLWVDDGVRLWVDGEPVIDGWQEGAIKNYVADVDLDEGTHQVRVEYFQAIGVAIIQLQIGYLQAPVDGPPGAAISGPTRAAVNQPLTFSARNSSVAGGSHLTTFEWTLGDGTRASGVDVSHSYTRPGVYEVTLTVTDDKDRSDTAVQQVEITGEPAPPEPMQPVAIIHAPSQAQVGQPVTFDAGDSVSETPILSYLWAFGDGTTADAVRVEKRYDAPGVYNVTLIVTNEQAAQSQPATHQINVVPQAVPPTLAPTEPPGPEPEATDTPQVEGQGPVAVINVSSDGQTALPGGVPVTVEVGQPLYFIGSGSQPGDSNIVSYTWDMGDRQEYADSDVTHAYPAPGTYFVSLTVTDANSLANTAYQEVQVTEPQ